MSDVKLLPLPAMPRQVEGYSSDYWTQDQIEDYAIDYARACVEADREARESGGEAVVVTYRLLSSADEIRADDEFLGDDTVTWLPVGKEFLSASMRGKKYNPSFLQPMRRETPFTAAQQEADHD